MAVRKTSSKTAGSENAKQKSVDEMNSELRNARDAIHKLLISGDSQQAEACYEVGRLVLEVKNNENKYGKEGVKLLSRDLGHRKDFFYDCARVVETWSKPDFDELMHREGENGKHLSFSHLVELLQEKDEDREARINEVLDEGLSVRVMRERIKARQRGGEQQEKAHHQVLARMEKRCQKLARDMEVVLAGVKKDGTMAADAISHLSNMAQVLGDASAGCMRTVEQQEAARKPVPEKPAVAAQAGDTKHELHSVEKVSSSTEQHGDIRDVPNIGGPDAPQNENPAAEQ